MVKRKTPSAEDIHLTSAQAGMLLFFVGIREMPCASAPTTRALAARGLLVRDDRTMRYCLTELGHAVVERLDPNAADESKPSPAKGG